MTRRKLGGYADNAALNRAQRATDDAIRVTQRLQTKAKATGAGWLYRYVAGLAQAHSEILQGLSEMQEIRSKKGENE